MKIIQHFLTALMILVGITWVVAQFHKSDLPTRESLVSDISKLPIQNPTEKEPFDFEYKGANYLITPQSSYEIWGLVVSHNDIRRFSDIYHTAESVDLKDVCVIWGNNAREGYYEPGKYKSGSWTCYWEFSDAESWRQFVESQISNNHLLATDPAVQKEIRNVQVGDQIHLKGYLVNYKNESTGWTRETSLTRKDTGNHACEVMFVEEFNNLQEGNRLWYALVYWAKITLFSLGVLKILLMIVESHRAIKKLDKNEHRT